MDVILGIIKNGKLVRGKKHLSRYAKGERLTRNEAILAKCYECMNGYTDGVVDCGIKECPLYPYNPTKGR